MIGTTPEPSTDAETKRALDHLDRFLSEKKYLSKGYATVTLAELRALQRLIASQAAHLKDARIVLALAIDQMPGKELRLSRARMAQMTRTRWIVNQLESKLDDALVLTLGPDPRE